MKLLTQLYELLISNGPNFLILITTSILIPVIASDWMVERGRIRSNHSKTLNGTTMELKQNLSKYFGLFPDYDNNEWYIMTIPKENLPFHSYYISHLETGYSDVYDIYKELNENYDGIKEKKLYIINKIDRMIRNELDEYNLPYTFELNIRDVKPQINLRNMGYSLLTQIESQFNGSEQECGITVDQHQVYYEPIDTNQTGACIILDPRGICVYTLDYNEAIETQKEITRIKTDAELNEEIKQYIETANQFEPRMTQLSNLLNEIDQEVILRETIKGNCKHSNQEN